MIELVNHLFRSLLLMDYMAKIRCDTSTTTASGQRRAVAVHSMNHLQAAQNI